RYMRQRRSAPPTPSRCRPSSRSSRQRKFQDDDEPLPFGDPRCKTSDALVHWATRTHRRPGVQWGAALVRLRVDRTIGGLTGLAARARPPRRLAGPSVRDGSNVAEIGVAETPIPLTRPSGGESRFTHPEIRIYSQRAHLQGFTLQAIE